MQFLALSLTRLCGSAGFFSLLDLGILFCKTRSCVNRIKPLEGAGKEWAPEAQHSRWLWKCRSYITCFVFLVSQGPDGMPGLPGFPVSTTVTTLPLHSAAVPTWSLHLEHHSLHLRAQALAPSCSWNFSLLPTPWRNSALCSVPWGFIFSSAVVLLHLEWQLVCPCLIFHGCSGTGLWKAGSSSSHSTPGPASGWLPVM